ncbi:MAG: class C sortase [Clostridia bacterium]|nr:class C sortase [Clostridia bacterium]
MRKILRFSAIIMLIAGLCVFCYPIVLKLKFNIQKNNLIDSFNNLREEIRQGINVTPESEGELPYKELRQAMLEYNEKLFLNGQEKLVDQLSYEKAVFFPEDYGLKSDILGYISIPSIDVELPIFNGASVENMSKGATYLVNTSLPIAGENTNCVIAAHTRDRGIYMFKRITELKTGDEIKITNFWETLVYKVTDTKIIYPDDIQSIRIQEGKQLLTLSTCYPYPENYQRYLVYAELVP